MKIILDPGHGSLGNPRRGLNPDPGAVAPGGAKESVVALAYALTLKAELAAAGYTVKMTRSDETKTDYSARTAMCGPEDVFISIHLNMPGSYGLMYYRSGDARSMALARALQRGLKLKYLWATKRSRFGRLYIDDAPRSARTVMIEIGAVDQVANTREARLAWAREVAGVLKAAL